MRDVQQETAGLLVQRNQGKISLLVEKEAEKYYKISNKFKNVSYHYMFMIQFDISPCWVSAPYACAVTRERREPRVK